MGKRKTIIYNDKQLEQLEQNQSLDSNATIIEVYNKDTNPINYNNYHIKVVTNQCAPIKTVMEILNSLLPSANLCFTKDKLSLTAFNITETLLVNMELDAVNFEEYFCAHAKYSIGIKLSNFHKIINSTSSNNILHLMVDKNDPDKLIIQIVLNEKKTMHNWKMNLLDTKPNKIGLFDISIYPVLISISSNYLQKICRDAGKYTQQFEIRRNSNKQLVLIFNSDNMKHETIIGETPENLIFLKNENVDDIIQGIYSLKDLTTFTKCTSISDKAILYISNTLPLMIEYSVGNLGKIQLCMNQVTL